MISAVDGRARVSVSQTLSRALNLLNSFLTSLRVVFDLCSEVLNSLYIYIYIYIYIFSTKNLQGKLPITLHTNYLTNTTRTLLPRGAIDHDNPVAN